MSLDVAQDVSAVTELVFAGLKVTGYSVVTACSVLGSHTIKYYWYKEKRMEDTVAHWRNVLSHLTKTQQTEIGPETLLCMFCKLDQLDRRLSLLAINHRKATLWSRAVGRHADRVRKLERLVEQTDADLRTQTEQALLIDSGSSEPESRASTPLGRTRDLPATLVDDDLNTCLNGRGPTTTPPCAELAQPPPALLAPDWRLRTAELTQIAAASSQSASSNVPSWSDHGDDSV